MALVRAGDCVDSKKRTIEDYELCKRKVLAQPLLPTEYLKDGMIRCKRCHMPKIFDDPAHFRFTKCCCKCEQEAWERARNGMSPIRRMKETEIRAGDFNPFD